MRRRQASSPPSARGLPSPPGRPRNFPGTMLRRFIPLALATVGLLLFGHGGYIHAKALLAQVLLERAFTESIATHHPVKPWSWADTWPAARIEVQRLNASAIVLAGSSGQALALRAGHVALTPAAGERGGGVY